MIEVDTQASLEMPPAATPGSTPAPLTVYLRAPEEVPLDGGLGWLARRFGLDTFSTSLLGLRARLEMKAAALVLLVVFCFDLAAWTLLFNTILHTELLALDLWTIAAVLAGLLFSSMVVLYERQFLTADVSTGWRRLALPTAIRFAVILSSAFVTAQPVELLFFRQPILARTHQEGIRRQVATRRDHLRKLDGLLAQQKQALAELPIVIQRERPYEQAEEAHAELQSALVARDDLQTKLNQATRNAAVWKDRELSSRRARDAARLAWEKAVRLAVGDDAAAAEAKLALERAERAVAAAARQRQHWSALADQYRVQLGVADGTVGRAKSLAEERERALAALRDKLQKRIENGSTELRREEERLQRWVRKLRELTPEQLGEPTVEAITAADGARTFFGAPKAFDYQVPSYDFFEQLRVLADLRRGDPPVWSGVSTSVAADLAQVYSLDDPVSCAERPASAAGRGCDPQRWSRHLAATAVYRYSYYVIYAIALVIPLMVFATKLLMAPELKAYYSAAAQARAGNADALRMQRLGERSGGHP